MVYTINYFIDNGIENSQFIRLKDRLKLNFDKIIHGFTINQNLMIKEIVYDKDVI